MGTKWSEIISNHAMLEIDDVRLQEDAANNPAAFLRRMSLYMVNAIPYSPCRYRCGPIWRKGWCSLYMGTSIGPVMSRA